MLLWRFRFIGRRPEYEEVRNFVLSKMPRGGIAAEIGVDQGNFSQQILRIAQPRQLYLIDPWLPDSTGQRTPAPEERYRSVRQRFAKELLSGTAVLMRESSASAVSKFGDASLDWIYIDGDHHYEAVKHDLEQFFPKVKPGGFIVCDDYHYAGTWNDGVTLAVDEFMLRGITQKVFKRRSQFVMRKIKAKAWRGDQG